VSGLPDCAVNELLEFEDGTSGLALNLDEESIGAVVLGEGFGIEEGQPVKATGGSSACPSATRCSAGSSTRSASRSTARVTSSAASRAGRDPGARHHGPQARARAAADRHQVDRRDDPIGRGQRELIIGDRKTGKTAVAVDAIINQRGLGVKCIYVAVGLKGSTVAQTVETLRKFGRLEYTVVVAAPASDPAPFKYLAPYSGCAMGQHWMENGEHALIVYDDLSKQAEAYRQLSLLLRRPPGREAYPGDVFYLHSRLLERPRSSPTSAAPAR
jgi:F-type H+-transporting ATPase subunit alpha